MGQGAGLPGSRATLGHKSAKITATRSWMEPSKLRGPGVRARAPGHALLPLLGKQIQVLALRWPSTAPFGPTLGHRLQS